MLDSVQRVYYCDRHSLKRSGLHNMMTLVAFMLVAVSFFTGCSLVRRLSIKMAIAAWRRERIKWGAPTLR